MKVKLISTHQLRHWCTKCHQMSTKVDKRKEIVRTPCGHQSGVNQSSAVVRVIIISAKAITSSSAKALDQMNSEKTLGFTAHLYSLLALPLVGDLSCFSGGL
jgi:hypothetical protein